ncbi:hypothetical protein I350_02215 [Cryptococcus amylolentus CBS 6273]|uniref:Uncharacterized protein n=1 Tax=Cryptococcus amylolentus CBS 6273 TaxID=1296118 RepID=A0A1E3KAB3_9TREE|nr:hypothetical protein I350_02215 [Cryptococcus amylolentus CBS 6273]
MSAAPHAKTPRAQQYVDPPCVLTAITQYQCSPEQRRGHVTCWPLERIFRQCGENKPVIEVTNRLVKPSPSSKSDSEKVVVDPVFL